MVDFHSLRKTFITNLTKSGVAPKTAQLLARHSDINLTMNTYTTLDVLDQAAGVEALPPVPTGEPPQTEDAQELRATGTDDQDRTPGATGVVPTMVPSGAHYGAERCRKWCQSARIGQVAPRTRLHRSERRTGWFKEDPSDQKPQEKWPYPHAEGPFCIA